MNGDPKRSDGSVSGRGALPSPARAVALPTIAWLRAEELVTELDRVHGISADIHELRSGNAIVSVYRGLLAYSDGEYFWWTSPELDRLGDHLLSAASATATAAERLAEHYEILRVRPLTTRLGYELPLLADVILAEHVDPC